MTNVEYIKSLDIRQLAALLVRCDHEEDIDYDWDEEPYTRGMREFWRTSDGETFGKYEYAGAVEHELQWLGQDFDENEDIWAAGAAVEE